MLTLLRLPRCPCWCLGAFTNVLQLVNNPAFKRFAQRTHSHVEGIKEKGGCSVHRRCWIHWRAPLPVHPTHASPRAMSLLF